MTEYLKCKKCGNDTYERTLTEVCKCKIAIEHSGEGVLGYSDEAEESERVRYRFTCTKCRKSWTQT